MKQRSVEVACPIWNNKNQDTLFLTLPMGMIFFPSFYLFHAL